MDTVVTSSVLGQSRFIATTLLRTCLHHHPLHDTILSVFNPFRSLISLITLLERRLLPYQHIIALLKLRVTAAMEELMSPLLSSDGDIVRCDGCVVGGLSN